MKKGFTLIEVLAVVTLLGLIALVAIPKVVEQKNNKEKEINANLKKVLFVDTATYIENNGYEIKPGKKYCVKVSDLIDNDAISIDASDFKNNVVNIVIDENFSYSYSLDTNCY